MAASGNKTEETENAPTQTKISWPNRKESYELKDVIGKLNIPGEDVVDKYIPLGWKLLNIAI